LKINAQRRAFQTGSAHAAQLRVDSDDVGLLVGSERLFGLELMLQHGEIGFRGVGACARSLDDALAQGGDGDGEIEDAECGVAGGAVSRSRSRCQRVVKVASTMTGQPASRISPASLARYS